MCNRLTPSSKGRTEPAFGNFMSTYAKLLAMPNCWFQSYGNTLAALYTHYRIMWTVKHSVFGTRVSAVL